MRRMSLVQAVLAAGILIATPLIKGTEVTTASQPKRDESARCFSSARGNNAVAALMSFAGYRRVSLGLPWEEISTLSLRNGK